MTDALAIGDRVHVPGVGTGRLRERRGTALVVEIKGIPVMVPAALVQAAEPPKRKRNPAASPAATGDVSGDISVGDVPAARAPAAANRPDGPLLLDLHGLTVADALEALDGFLDAAMREGRDTVLVVHGRSGGRIRGAVHRRLGELPSVRGFRVDPRNPGQTIVTL